MARAALERGVQITLVPWLRLVLPLGSIVAAVKNEHQARSNTPGGRARFYAAREAEGVLAGFPDIIALMPGLLVLIETKRPIGGALSEAQSLLHPQLRAIGYAVILATSIETARYGLIGLGVRLRETPGQLMLPPKVRDPYARRSP